MMKQNAFSLTGDKYDQTRFQGRFLKFVNMVDPRTLLPGLFFNMPPKQAQDALEDYQIKGRAKTTWSDDELWTAKKILASRIHPDTGDVIPAPFRMSGFVPFGTPIVVGMLLASTPGQNIFWQWANQSHNAAVNYCNRNRTVHVSTLEMSLSYVVAVTSAVGISLAMQKVVERIKMPVVSRFVPFMAVATANVLNVSMMRRMEIQNGISVFDQAGNKLGHSVVAAKKALMETAFSRLVLPIPILVLSPILMLSLEKISPVFLARPVFRVSAQALICTGTFMIGLPISLSLFRDRGEIDVTSLEFEIKEKALTRGVAIAEYNKGL